MLDATPHEADEANMAALVAWRHLTASEQRKRHIVGALMQMFISGVYPPAERPVFTPPAERPVFTPVPNALVL